MSVDITQLTSVKVLAFDPGVTTGVASGLIDLYLGKMFASADQERFDEKTLFEYIDSIKPQCLVWERFEFRRGRNKTVLYSRNLIGVMELYSKLHPDIHVHKQMPGDAMAYHTDKLLKSCGLYRPSMDHANDAMRHLLRWFEFGPGYKYNKNGYEAA